MTGLPYLSNVVITIASRQLPCATKRHTKGNDEPGTLRSTTTAATRTQSVF
jgi:hypothetical protein